jgi:hypothetical protein
VCKACRFAARLNTAMVQTFIFKAGWTNANGFNALNAVFYSV